MVSESLREESCCLADIKVGAVKYSNECAYRAPDEKYERLRIIPIVVIAPSKEVIYPEYLSRYVASYDTTALRGFIPELRRAGVTVIDGEALLLAQKAQQPLLFHKQDFHWDRLAAHLVADAVMAQVAQTIPAQRP